MSETELTRQLIRGIEGDFEILREVAGCHPIYDASVRIDLMLRAKPHLQAAGFTSDWFGVECKWFDVIDGATSKATRMVWQSITYAQSTFLINGKKVTPSFVVVHIPGSIPRAIDEHLNSLLSLGHYGNVGRLYFYNDGFWGIKFDSIYARSNSEGFYLSKSKLPKRRAGSV